MTILTDMLVDAEDDARVYDVTDRAVRVVRRRRTMARLVPAAAALLVDDDSLVAAVRDLVARPFAADGLGRGSWLVGETESAPGGHFAPIASSPSLYETPADDDGTIGDSYEQVYTDFKIRRRRAADALAAIWGPPRACSFAAELVLK